MGEVDLRHRCEEPVCVSYRQPTHPNSCLCHKTEVQVARERINQLERALEPFATYGIILAGQRVRDDVILLELWGNQITSKDYINAAETLNGKD